MQAEYKQLLRDRFLEVLRIEPGAGAIEYEGRWHSWQELAETAAAVHRALDEAGVPDGAEVGWFARNRPSAVGAALGILVSRRCCSIINPHRSNLQLSNDLETGPFVAAIAEVDDWQRPGLLDAANGHGIAALRLDEVPGKPLSRLNARTSVRADKQGAVDGAVIMMSSGTTGTPKRVPRDWKQLVFELERGARPGAGITPVPTAIKRSPTLLQNSFGHSSGCFYMLMSMYHARPIVLFEKFSLHLWLDAVARHKPRVASLVPPLVREVLAADVPDGALSSLQAVRVGTAPLDDHTKQAFEARFGIPLLLDYGATEFRGAVAQWTLEDYKRYAASKPGSVGRIIPNIEARIVDAKTGAVVPPGEVGLIEARSRDGSDLPWIRTTDLAFLDDDGFLYLKGRGDDAIIRGGFKILPETVADVLRRHSAVRDIAIVGKPHDRLGQIPVAFVELKDGPAGFSVDELAKWARTQLAAYEVPSEFRVLERLPRTVSLKVDRPALRALLA